MKKCIHDFRHSFTWFFYPCYPCDPWFAALSRPRVFRWGLPQFLGLANRVHRSPHFVYFVPEQIADEQVGEVSLVLGVAVDEATKAEAVVVFADQAPHPGHAAHEPGLPLAQLCGGSV